MMRIAIFGSGAVGSYFGGRLAEAGEDIIFIARGKHLDAMQQHGLNVKSIEGDFELKDIVATDDTRSVGSVDLVIFCVKTWQIASAMEILLPLVSPQTVLLPLQNGVTIPDILSESIDKRQILGGLCKLMVAVSKPGEIHHTGIHPTLVFGELDNKRTTRVREILKVFSNCQGMTASIPDDIHIAIWEKFLFITTIGGVGAITRSPVGVYRSVPGTRELLTGAMQEIYLVANARGIHLRKDMVDITLKSIDQLPAHGMASMQRDIMNGVPSELHELPGAVVQIAKEESVPCPLNEFIYYSLLPSEMQARGIIQTPG